MNPLGVAHAMIAMKNEMNDPIKSNRTANHCDDNNKGATIGKNKGGQSQMGGN